MSEGKTVRGIVLEERPNLLYLVEITGGPQVLCYLAGKIRKNKVRVYIGDTVEVVLDPYGGKTTNRIIWRL